MPQLGESIAEGTVSVWLKGIGERVERDEPILEISTDKVDAEIPSPAGGTLVEILVGAGETVEVGTVVAFIDTGVAAAEAAPAPSGEAVVQEPVLAADGDVADIAAAAGLPSAATTAAATPTPSGEPARAVASAPSVGAATGPSPTPSGGPLPGDRATSNGAVATLEERMRTRSSPLVRRIAAEHGIDLRSIEGSGRLGRVTKADILTCIQNGGPGAVERARRESHAARGGEVLTWEEFYGHVNHPLVAAAPEDRVEPMSRMTKLIAEHMVLSQRISPHAHSYIEVDYSRIDQVRSAQRGRWAEQGVKVSYTAFVARAVAAALREYPKVNAAISGTEVIYRAEVNVGVAVALPWGLIVPVVKRADELSLVGLAHRITDLAERARAKMLSPEEVQDGTFTITNPGVFGTVIGFPIINQPQVAILGVGGIEKRPVVITDEFGNDAIVPRKRGFISLGFDHRLVNGADGDAFLARLKELLESATE
jgi:2-oxoglutarate dehydrogenase E2 component (dihydrolipoamide succinyltransferase)